jgi:modulator of FtsH protease
VNAAYAPDLWHDFFLAVSGAGAALAGLVFVALSINLREIIRGTGLVSRAGEAVTLLISVVVIGLIGLVPDQSPDVLGTLLAIIGLVLCIFVTRARLRALPLVGTLVRDDSGRQAGPTREQWVWTLIVGEAGTVPIVIAGISLAAGFGGGLYWLVPGTVFAVIASMLDAWVLLVEIQR